MTKKKFYVSPLLIVCELEIEYAVLAASGGDIDDSDFGGSFGAPVAPGVSTSDDAYFIIKRN